MTLMIFLDLVLQLTNDNNNITYRQVQRVMHVSRTDDTNQVENTYKVQNRANLAQRRI